MGSVGDKNQVVYVDGDIPQLPLQLGQLLVDSSQIAPGVPNLQQCVSQNPLLYVPLVGGAWIDVRWFGVVGSGDEHVGIQAAIAAAAAQGGGYVFFPNGNYNIGATTITVAENVILLGETSEMTFVTYTGSGVAFDHTRGGNGIENMYILTTAASGNGIRFGDDCRRSILRRVTAQSTYLPASGRTGKGLLLQTTAAATTFSGNMMLEQVYMLGYKYGIDFDSYEFALKTWTTVVGNQVFVNGPGAGVVAGSRCIRMGATTNGVGSAIFGGTLEGCEVPIEVGNGGFGIDYKGDIEGNTSDLPILGATACGEIVAHPGGMTYRLGANGAANRWFAERLLNGEWDRETYYNHSFTLYDNGGTAFFDLYRGASRIAGGSPTLKFRVATGNSGADAAGERNYIQFNGQRLTWTAGSPPASGTWAQGDVANNASAAVGSPKSWLCTVAGTPGTWVSTGNL